MTECVNQLTMRPWLTRLHAYSVDPYPYIDLANTSCAHPHGLSTYCIY